MVLFYLLFDLHKELSFEIFTKVLNKLGQEQKMGRQASRHVTLVKRVAKGHLLELESKEIFSR